MINKEKIMFAKLELGVPSDIDNVIVGTLAFKGKKKGLKFITSAEPTSFQSRNDPKLNLIKKELSEKSKDEFCQEYLATFWGKPVSLTIYFFMTEENIKNKDIDNLAKLTIDGLKGHLFPDDNLIYRLEVHKILVQNKFWQRTAIHICKYRVPAIVAKIKRLRK